jgi:hypothetical protein
MGDITVDINNYIDGNEYKEINSPRTMEACLRQGVDPSDLYPRDKESYRRKGMTSDMLDLAYANAERKRDTMIEEVKKERKALIKFSMRPSQSQPGSPAKGVETAAPAAATGGSNLVEQVRPLSLSLFFHHLAHRTMLTFVSLLFPYYFHTINQPNNTQ